MYSKWTQHLKDPRDQEKFKEQVILSVEVLRRLKDILTEFEDSLTRTETTVNVYSSPSWAYEQAHKNGNRETIQKVKQLIDIDQQRINNEPKPIG